LDYLSSMHVFQWAATAPSAVADRRPLVEGAVVWRSCLDRVASNERERSALLEFVRDDAPEQALADARVLGVWLAERSQAAVSRTLRRSPGA
jgi:hypothetical protein